ncbi:MAG TPA: NAD(P)H-dependent oxidoreductase [Spirochaetota bacterium]|nr:NAD(P)H-dependent oxidoreductase [Spirochaetota bacterium]HPS87023.1 NAD(P)H-dependent oxidoreductase [Spirochaetota bacterium]
MKVTVLNGSPKGDQSVTMQYVKFVEKKFPSHEFNYINIAQKINKLEDDTAYFNSVIDEIKNSRFIIWGAPLYVCLIPSQYKRFIELIWERGAADSFAGKYTAVITTSIHFFDHTAHNYLRGICEDLNMNYAGGLSPDMYDLMKEDGRKNLLLFAESVFESAEKKLKTSRSFKKPDYAMPGYIPEHPAVYADSEGKRILILSDREYSGDNMDRMIKRMQGAFGGNDKYINISNVDIKGGCLGCCECGLDYRCVYTGKDGFIDFYNEEVKTADIIIFAGEIKDRYLSAKWKQMFDRAFFNTHTPTLKGKQAGFLLSGPLGQIANLREILQAYFEWQGANLVDIVTDENSSGDIDNLIDSLASRLVKFSGSGYVRPATFLGVGGMRIFRDDIWGRLKFVFQADYRYYEENGIFDFPQYDEKTKDINAKMIALTDNPDMREKVRKMIKTEMVKPMKYVVDNK